MAKKVDYSQATPALSAVDGANIDYDLDIHGATAHSSTGFALDAAASMGVDSNLVFKTLMVDIDAEHVVAVVPADTTLNMKLLGKAGGGKHVHMMDTKRAQVVTGYVVGGISPIGQKTTHRVFLDESAILLEKIYVSAGRRGWSLLISPDDLLAITGGSYANIADHSRRF